MRVIDILEEIESYSSPVGSSTIRVVDISESTGSHSASVASSTLRVIDLLEQVDSHSISVTSSSSRSGVTYGRTPGSHSGIISSYSWNERTSLELIDHPINWDDSTATWYTDWFQENRILGNEDTLAIRSLVVENAKQPCAKVVVEYDRNGDGLVDAKSDPIELERNQMVREITGIPVDENGYYRLRIMEYSGYNSLYAIDTAIVH